MWKSWKFDMCKYRVWKDCIISQLITEKLSHCFWTFPHSTDVFFLMRPHTLRYMTAVFFTSWPSFSLDSNNGCIDFLLLMQPLESKVKYNNEKRTKPKFWIHWALNFENSCGTTSLLHDYLTVFCSEFLICAVSEKLNRPSFGFQGLYAQFCTAGNSGLFLNLKTLNQLQRLCNIKWEVTR
jgi:hypothetical protein